MRATSFVIVSPFDAPDFSAFESLSKAIGDWRFGTKIESPAFKSLRAAFGFKLFQKRGRSVKHFRKFFFERFVTDTTQFRFFVNIGGKFFKFARDILFRQFSFGNEFVGISGEFDQTLVGFLINLPVCRQTFFLLQPINRLFRILSPFGINYSGRKIRPVEQNLDTKNRRSLSVAR